MSQESNLQSTLREISAQASLDKICKPDEISQINAIGTSADVLILDSKDTEESKPEQVAAAVEDKDSDVRQRISKMSIPQKLKLALFGNSVCRLLLMRDANKIVQMTVLKNPQLSLREVEDFAKNSNTPDYVLRSISDNQAWVRGYTVKVALVCNPKTPQDLSMKWLRFLNQNDLKRISKSKSVPQLIAVTAKKRLADMET